jgi:pilus assembly protein CpaC
MLGEIPVLGALFRSSEFQTDRSELVFIITPRLVKPLPNDYRLPTDDYVEPTRSEFFLGGRQEGTPRAETRPTTTTAAASGFDLK